MRIARHINHNDDYTIDMSIFEIDFFVFFQFFVFFLYILTYKRFMTCKRRKRTGLNFDRSDYIEENMQLQYEDAGFPTEEKLPS